MNTVSLIGRLTKDPDVRYTTGEQPMAVARYTLAVDRAVAKTEQKADFISIIAFGKRAEFAEKYLHKGTKIAIRGRIQTGSYKHRDGYTVYTTDVVVEEQEFCEPRPEGKPEPTPAKADDGFMQIPDSVDDDGLPFN